MPLRSVFNILLLLALLSFAVLGCSTSEESTKPAVSQARVPKEQFFDYKLTETSAGIKQWVLISDEMRKYSDQEDVELTTVMMDFFRDGTHFSVLTADSGKAHLLTKDVYTWGNVVVITDDGRRLECEELYFSNETQLIHNEVFNTFTRGNDVMTGIGLEATPDLDYIEIKRQVEAEVIDQANGSAADPKADSRTESDLH